ncbi:hypothetical protein A9Z42_0066080 [Trichoderma parareesei]|uniref:Heterokaryon incompatibility domain-containing protein n=1 Tax=Trichoderma parareesei TaxID=858221 RepID=A0A2H2ZEA5_TRIPA|nr:hypothetical protein A9Z42_0066080 [Trichoderma parareesei]
MQDNEEWSRHASLTPKLYNNADLTIVAGRSNDAHQGFLRPEYTSDSSTVSNNWIDRKRNHNIGPTNESGWCYQELLMSRRAIIFGEQQLSFRCRERHEFEDGECVKVGQRESWYNLLLPSPTTVCLPAPKDDHKPDNTVQRAAQPARYHPNMPGNKRRPLLSGKGSDPALVQWYAMIADYPTRKFYDPTEIHSAISGVVRLFQSAFVERLGPGSDRYMAGLWESDMIPGLLWRSSRIQDPDLPALQEPMHQGRVIQRAPSWSWMALTGPIRQGGLDNLGVPCCVATWGVNNWPGPMAEYSKSPEIFKLVITGYVRRLRISQYSTRDHAEYSAWGNIVPHYPTESMNRHTFRLEAEEAKPLITGIRDPSMDWPNIAATGIFDMERKATNRPSSITALRLTSEEGLLLDEVYDSRGDTIGFRRMGVFVIENPVAFYPAHSIAANAYGGYDVIEGRLPVGPMTLL